MGSKIIIPSWETLQSNGLLSNVKGQVCIRKIVYQNYLKKENPEAGDFIDSLLTKWPSRVCLTKDYYEEFRNNLKARLRKFSDNGLRIVLEGEEEDDNV